MVVTVGLMLVEPLADVDVNVPGVMAMLAAPATDQLRVLLVPEFMLGGFAAKDVICGAEPFPAGVVEPGEAPAAQPSRPAQESRMRTSAQNPSRLDPSPRELRVFLQNESGECMRTPSLLITTAV